VTKAKIIVVGIDGSAGAEIALTWAADEAARRGADLHLVQAYSVPIGYAGPGGMIPAGLFDEARRLAEGSLARAQQAAQKAHLGLKVATSAWLTTPYAALRDASESVLLTVVGSQGQGQVRETLLGSVALKVASLTDGIVVVVRSGPHAESSNVRPPTDGPVMVGIDGSAESEAALAFAYEEAATRGVSLVALHSWDDEPLKGFLRAYPLEVSRAEIDDQQRRLLAEELVGWPEKYPHVPLIQAVLAGRPTTALLEANMKFGPSLIVVGSRGRGGFAGLLLGSTSRELIAHAPCPVAVVHRQPH
jgi:nucleotide-binding universal stress UspA family protein